MASMLVSCQSGVISIGRVLEAIEIVRDCERAARLAPDSKRAELEISAQGRRSRRVVIAPAIQLAARRKTAHVEHTRLDIDERESTAHLHRKRARRCASVAESPPAAESPAVDVSADGEGAAEAASSLDRLEGEPAFHQSRDEAARSRWIPDARLLRGIVSQLAPVVAAPTIGRSIRGDAAAVFPRAGTHLRELEPAGDEHGPVATAFGNRGARVGHGVAAKLSAIVGSPTVPVPICDHGTRVASPGADA